MRLLLVEDYGPLRVSLHRGLVKQGFAVDSSGEGNEGHWFSTSNTYDAIILDIMLPGMGGIEILQALRKRGIDIPVLLLTAKDEVTDRVQGLDSGADDYLVKPFAVEELLARIRALIRRGHHRRDPVICVGNLSVSTVERRVQCLKCDIILTPREYSLLEYLAVHAEKSVSRQDIWEHVYDFNSNITSNVVDTMILRLRKKLLLHTSTAQILTRRGFGYMLCVNLENT